MILSIFLLSKMDFRVKLFGPIANWGKLYTEILRIEAWNAINSKNLVLRCFSVSYATWGNSSHALQRATDKWHRTARTLPPLPAKAGLIWLLNYRWQWLIFQFCGVYDYFEANVTFFDICWTFQVIPLMENKLNSFIQFTADSRKLPKIMKFHYFQLFGQAWA